MKASIPNTIHLIGPTWPKKKHAIAAAREVSAGHGGVNIAVFRTPTMGLYTLDWRRGPFWRWVRAEEG